MSANKNPGPRAPKLASYLPKRVPHLEVHTFFFKEATCKTRGIKIAANDHIGSVSRWAENGPPLPPPLCVGCNPSFCALCRSAPLAYCGYRWSRRSDPLSQKRCARVPRLVHPVGALCTLTVSCKPRRSEMLPISLCTFFFFFTHTTLNGSSAPLLLWLCLILMVSYYCVMQYTLWSSWCYIIQHDGITALQ